MTNVPTMLQQPQKLEEKYPCIRGLFGGYFHEDWMDVDGTVTGATQEYLNILESDIKTRDIKQLSRSFASLPQLYSEISDIVKKRPEEQYDIFESFDCAITPNGSKMFTELFFLTLLHLTEAEMRKRNIEIKENPILHTEE